MTSILPETVPMFARPRTRPAARVLVASALIGLLGASGDDTPQPIAPGERVLGVRRLAGVRESGFHNTEMAADRPFRWTDGAARLVVPLDGPMPAALTVRLGLSRPRPAKLTIRVNGTTLFEESVPAQEHWTRTFNLGAVPVRKAVTIEVLSDTFVPSRDDDRDLGVIVRGITLVEADRNFAGVNLAPEPVAGVEESGLHQPERDDVEGFRWTDGDTRLVVPIRPGHRFRSLMVRAEIPRRPKFHVRLTVDGHVLASEIAPAGQIWDREFPLDQVPAGRQVVIELRTATVAPGPSRPNDGRTLGVRLIELTPRGD